VKINRMLGCFGFSLSLSLSSEQENRKIDATRIRKNTDLISGQFYLLFYKIRDLNQEI